MKPVTLAFALIVGIFYALPANAHNPYPYNYYYAGPSHIHAGPYKARKKHVRKDRRWRAWKAEQVRKECRMYAFGYWRYHPEYRHCKYN